MDGFGMDGCAADGLTGRRRSSTAADGGAAGSTVVLARGYHPEVTISSTMVHLDNVGMDVQHRITACSTPNPSDPPGSRWRRSALEKSPSAEP